MFWEKLCFFSLEIVDITSSVIKKPQKIISQQFIFKHYLQNVNLFFVSENSICWQFLTHIPSNTKIDIYVYMYQAVCEEKKPHYSSQFY